MPKPKTLLKETKPKKPKHPPAPETTDEYLAAGVEQEEGGEKWRAGDVVKAMRFFMRAIETYDNGLVRYPKSFDLAYNKARVQYEISQHPKLASQLPASPAQILRVALQSHREALDLQQDNSDALFNTAQVLTSLAEAIVESKRPSEQQIREASQHLREALELFQRCLLLQELRYTEFRSQIEEMESNDLSLRNGFDKSIEDISTQSQDHEKWATIVEPVTKDTLIDTAVAQLETLSTLCSLLALDPGSGLAWVEEYSSDFCSTRLDVYTEGTDRYREVSLARAKFWSALTEVSYRSGQINIETYKRELSSVFGPALDLSQDPVGLCDRAESLISFNAALAEITPPESKESSIALTSRWQSLSSALDALTTASQLSTAANASRIHLERGDVEMYRWRLGRPPWNHPTSQENASRLLQNAQTYYRGASALARRNGATDEEKEAACKEALAAGLDGQKDKLEILGSGKLDVLAVAEDMVEDGMVPSSEAQALLS